MVFHSKKETHKNLWYLDISCSNHMSGDTFAFSELDETFCENVKVGDNSKVSVMGKRKGYNPNQGQFFQSISNVLFVSNLLNVGQLREEGTKSPLNKEFAKSKTKNWA